jgi:hypothetical protein
MGYHQTVEEKSATNHIIQFDHCSLSWKEEMACKMKVYANHNFSAFGHCKENFDSDL